MVTVIEMKAQITDSNSLQWLATTASECEITHRWSIQHIIWVSKHFLIPNRNLKAYSLKYQIPHAVTSHKKKERIRTQRSLIAWGENANIKLASAPSSLYKS